MKNVLVNLLIFLLSASALSADKIYDEKGDLSDVLADCLSSDSGDIKSAEDFIRLKRPRKLASMLADTALKDPSQGKRRAAFDALKYFPVNSISDIWIGLLETSESLMIKKDTIEFLADYNSRSFVVPFAAELSSQYTVVRQAAAAALKKYSDDRVYPFILDLASSQDPVKRIYAIEAMFHLYDRRFASLMNDLLKDENKSVRVYAVKCAVNNNLTNVIYIIRDMAVNDPVDDARIAAIEAIGDFRDSGSIYQLGKTISDQNRLIRLETVESIYKISSFSAASYLSAQLGVEEDDEITNHILDCLILFRRVHSIQQVESVMLDARSERIRIKAAYLLGIIKDDRAAASLVKALEDSDHRVRAEACNSLGNYRSKNTLAELISVIKNDKVSYVRSAALYSVKRMNDRSALIQLFEIFADEMDPVFREILRIQIVEILNKYK